MRTRTLILVLALSAPSSSAQDPSTVSPGPDDVWSLLDDLVPFQMRADQLPGAAVAVVEDGQIVFAGGYGVSSLETGAPVEEDTLFRIGSISKVFAALALTQLAERGRIRLEAAITPHLDGLAIGGPYACSLCFWHLLTHTAGFDQIGLDRHARGPADQLTPRQFLDGRLVLVRPPGQVTCYDTYAITLAGYLVERLSGNPYPQHLREQVFEPLGMERTFVQVPDELRGDLAIGYGIVEGRHVPQSYEYYNTTPASSVDSTAHDMALLLEALLGDGSNEHGRLLSATTMEGLEQPQFRNHPELPGFTHGFWEESRNGVRALQHGGSMLGYTSRLTFFPGRDVGVFTTCNRDGETGPFPQIHEVVLQRLVDRWFPRPAPEEPAKSREPSDAVPFAGLYTDNGYCHTCEEGFGWGWSPFAVRAAEKGELEFWGQRWVERERGVFAERGGDRRAAFRTDTRGRVTHLFVGNLTYERLGDALLEEAVGGDWREHLDLPLVPRVLRELERWREAAEAYAAIATKRPRDGSAHFHAGVCWSRVVDAERALPHLERAIELGIQPEVAAYHGAAAVAAGGETERAFEWMERALELGLADPELFAGDPRLTALHEDPRFADWTAAVREARARRESSGMPLPVDAIPRWAGRYAAESGLEVVVLERDGMLAVEVPGQPLVRLSYEGGEAFHSASNALVRIVFESGGTRAAGFTFHDDDGSSFAMQRIE